MGKKLIIGLGNPGTKYENTRHNVGFLYVDSLVKAAGLSWSSEKKFKAMVAKNKDYIYMKPQTFMNRSGESVAKARKYFDVPFEDLLVVHDDVDLEELNYRFHKGRGAAGHHGVEDIIEKLGTNDFWRLRIGIGRPEHNGFEVEDYVLSELSDALVQYISEIEVEF